MKALGKRAYHSETRSDAAERTRASILNAGKVLFSRKGIDATTIALIAERAGVSEPTVYAVVKSKAGLLHALMHDAIFGPRFKKAQGKLEGVSDPVRRVAMSAHVARAVYEGESAELSLLMKSAAFSPELRKASQSFEALRREMQRERIKDRFSTKHAKEGLTKESAATLLWMFTSREVYHKLVHESGWSPDAFQDWLEQTLLETLTDGICEDRQAN